MFNFNDIHKIEIELTTQCQASCPMCSRNFHGLIANNNVKNISWNFEEFKKIINLEVLGIVKIINFCGAYGDPLICRDIKEISNYIRENSDAQLIISTNGSLHTEKWWTDFVSCLPTNHKIIFGIDGFKENHEKHRIGTSFKKIIDNAKAFIRAGGNAEAQFISFEHNKEDYTLLKKYLLDIGFSAVFKKYSYRFRHDSFSVLDKHYNEINKLFPDKDAQVVNYEDKDLPTTLERASQSESEIVCRSMHMKEIYIDAYKHLYPCCETAGIRYEIERLDEPNFNTTLPILKEQISSIHKEYNKVGYIDLRRISIKEVLNDCSYKEIWQRYWKLKKSFVCNIVCGKVNNQKFYDRDSQFF